MILLFSARWDHIMIRLIIRLVGCYSLVTIINAFYLIIVRYAKIDNILILDFIMLGVWLSSEYSWNKSNARKQRLK